MRNLKKGRSLAKRNNTIQNLRTRLELRQEEMHAISVQLESIELSVEEKNILKEKLNELNNSIQCYEREIASVEQYGTHNFISNVKPKQKKKGNIIKKVYPTPM